MPQFRFSVEMQLPVGDRRWLWAVRCSAFISLLITLASVLGELSAATSQVIP